MRTACRYGERLESHRAALGALAQIRTALFTALAAAPPAQALGLATGEASARLVEDVGALETWLVRQSSRWGAGAALMVGVALAGLAGWRCAAATAGFFIASVTIAWLIAQFTARRRGAALQQAAGRLKDESFALLTAAPELVAYELQDWAAERIAAEGQALAAAHQRLAAIEAMQASLMSTLSATAAVSVLLLARGAPLPLAALAVLAAVATLDGGVGLVRGLLRDGAAAEAARRLDPILAPPQSPPSPRPARAPPGLGPTCFALKLRRPGGGFVALAPGERLAVTGRSGAGKTTLMEKLVKLQDCDPGELALGGWDIARLTPQAARAAFAYAAQSAQLLSGAVAENLRLGAPTACEADLWTALFDAGLDARVEALPGRLEAQIGEGGERLSGGERRRLALARALLKPAPWLLLDEPTEGLDAQTEALVIERLRRRLQRTRQGLILVSHRPAPLTLCTRTLEIGVQNAWPDAA
jgi:ATP-binding cassette subfamily C protein CydC